MSTKILKGSTVALRRSSNIWRPVTEAETAAWHASDASKGMTDAGETKLAPRDKYKLADGRTYTVVRSRVTAPRGWRTLAHCALVVDTDGVEWYARKADIAAVS